MTEHMTIKDQMQKRQGERLRELQKEQGLTQGQLGKLINVSQKMISAIMTGRASLQPVYAEELANEFGYRAEWLLGHDPFKTKADLAEYYQQKDMENIIVELARRAGYQASIASFTGQDELTGYTTSVFSNISIKNPITNQKKSIDSKLLEILTHELISYSKYMFWRFMDTPESLEMDAILENYAELLRGENNGE